MNEEIAKILEDIAQVLDIKGESAFRVKAYRKAAKTLQGLEKDIALIYKESGVKGLQKIPGVGKGLSEKIEEFLKKGKIKYYQELQKETALRQIITHFFASKGLGLQELKQSAKQRKIIYSRYTKPAKDLLTLAGSLEKAKEAISKVADWANTRNLDYSIETIFKKWLELDRLKPKEIVKKPFYEGQQMVWSEAKKKWFVINDSGEWLEYADKESKIEWRIAK